MITQPIAPNPPGTNFIRFVKAIALNRGDPFSAQATAADWTTSPSVALALKTYVASMSTADALASYGLNTEFLTLLRETSVFERLKSRMLRIPPRLDVPIESTSPTAAWIGEGHPIPITAAVLGSVQLDLCKIGTATVLTVELVKRSGIAAEGVIRTILTNGVGYCLDSQFLTPSITAIAGKRPAAITSAGALTQASSGATAAQITSDLSAMIAALGSWRDPVWIMKPSTLGKIASLNTGFVGNVGGTPALMGLPVYTSLGSPQQVTLFDAASIAYVDDGGVEVDISGEASLEMETQPVQGLQSPILASGPMANLFQENKIAVKVIRQVSYKRTLDSGVVVMSVAY